jgi:hypothetical protein
MVSSPVDNQLSSYKRAPPLRQENAGQTCTLIIYIPENLAYLFIPKHLTQMLLQCQTWDHDGYLQERLQMS